MTDSARAAVSRLLIRCEDRPGIVAAVSGFLRDVGANITRSDQYSTDVEPGGTFFMRLEFSHHLDAPSVSAFEERFDADVARPFGMDWSVWHLPQGKRIAILVSRHDHCLVDLLWRGRRGELEGSVELVISNHEDTRPEVEAFGVPFVHIPVTKETKPAAEAAALERLAGNVDLVVLARYMQILSSDFLERIGCPVINIHHSFLPAFVGANPYERAHASGVKLIGATAHYVTEDLDEGPIIEQAVERVTHRHRVEDLTATGRDIERAVLATAVRAHLEDRVIVHGNRTVVF
jgi:formyltetrahydrofolate deformylase